MKINQIYSASKREMGKYKVKLSVPTDLYPTFLEVVGIPTDDNERKLLDGKSLVSLFHNEGTFSRDGLTWFMPHWMGVGTKDEVPPSAAIRWGDYKLIKIFEQRYELYSLREDLSETHNLADEMSDLVEELNRKLMVELTSQNAFIPKPNPLYDPSAEREYREKNAQANE